MIQHRSLELKLSEDRADVLTAGYRKVVEHLESGFPLDTRVLDQLKENLSLVVSDSHEWEDILKEIDNTGDFYCLHLLHEDNEVLNLPWAMAEDPVSGKPLGQLSQLYLTRGISTVFKGMADEAPLAPAPLKVLVMIASPVDAKWKERLSYENEERLILEACALPGCGAVGHVFVRGRGGGAGGGKGAGPGSGP